MSAADSPYRERRVLVLGATGFIGAWLARLLTAAGARLQLGHRDDARARAVYARWQIAGEARAFDCADARALGRVLDELRPEIVFNLAGYGVQRDQRDPAEAERVNVQAVAELARRLAEAPDPGGPLLRLVHVGSGFEYGPIGGDLAETSEPAPDSLYARTKLAASRELARLAASRGLRAVTARPFTVYGPGEGSHRLLPALRSAAARGEDVKLSSGEQRRDFIHVEDVVEGLLRLGSAEVEPGEAVNLATGRLTSVRGFVEIAARVLGIPDERLRFGALPGRPDEVDHDPVSIARLRARTGWAPALDIAAGVARSRAFEEARPA